MKRYIKPLTILLLVGLTIETASAACHSGSRYNVDSTIFSDNGWEQPISGTLTTSSGYDYDSDIYYCNHSFHHGGVDLVASSGTDVYAIDHGEVLNIVENDSATSNTSRIYIKHNSSDGDFIATYGHVDALDTLQVGDTVLKGEHIGDIVRYGTPEHLHFEIRNDGEDSTINDDSFGGIKGDIVDPLNYLDAYDNTILTRAEALKKIFDKFDISTVNNGFNHTRFGQSINIPTDVTTSTSHYNAIVTAYNRGVARGNSHQFYPQRDITLAEFLIMIIRAIPIPLDNPQYNPHLPSADQWLAQFSTAAYNAGIIEAQKYLFETTVSDDDADEILNRAYEYFLGPKSGISIYTRWNTQYADVDLYLFDQTVTEDISIKHDSYIVNNMNELRNSGGIVYWSNPSSLWGANLDYDSWGGNGNQPWAGFGEERVTVDALMIKRPGVYQVIQCYYDLWSTPNQPEQIEVQWWGINGGQNINTGGENFTETLTKGQCRYVGYLQTY